MEHYFNVLKKYAVFKGRASRSEFWYFNLFNFLIYLFLILVDINFNLIMPADNEEGILSFVYLILTFLPLLAVTVRRLHDISKSGWWILLPVIFLPITLLLSLTSFFLFNNLLFINTGLIVLYLMLIEKGVHYKNQYGDVPEI
jgi:uncharacterized membrane protein YhaH (DUF805 family)